MSKLSGTFLLLTSLTLIASCAPSQRIQSDYDTSVNFTQYRTYNFSSQTEIENPDFSELLFLRYSAAVEQQMLTLGYSKTDEPEILIKVLVDSSDMTSAPKVAKRRPMYPHSSPTTACPSSGDYNGDISRTQSSVGSLPTVCKFKDVSVTVEILDVELNRTIWTAVLLARIDENEKAVDLVQNIVYDTHMLFADSPLVTWREVSQSTK